MEGELEYYISGMEYQDDFNQEPGEEWGVLYAYENLDRGRGYNLIDRITRRSDIPLAVKEWERDLVSPVYVASFIPAGTREDALSLAFERSRKRCQKESEMDIYRAKAEIKSFQKELKENSPLLADYIKYGEPEDVFYDESIEGMQKTASNNTRRIRELKRDLKCLERGF